MEFVSGSLAKSKNEKRRRFRTEINRNGTKKSRGKGQVTPTRELESRVVQWLQESKPPSTVSIKTEPILEDMHESILEYNTDTVLCNEMSSSHDTLFHPDFADWATVQQTESKTKAPSFSAANDLKVFDDAIASISSLLRVTFSLEITNVLSLRVKIIFALCRTTKSRARLCKRASFIGKARSHSLVDS